MKKERIDYAKATDALYGQPKPIIDTLTNVLDRNFKNYIWESMKQINLGITHDEATALFQATHPILCNVDNWRRFIVWSYVTGLPMSVKTATDYLRAEADCKIALTLDPE